MNMAEILKDTVKIILGNWNKLINTLNFYTKFLRFNVEIIFILFTNFIIKMAFPIDIKYD